MDTAQAITASTPLATDDLPPWQVDSAEPVVAAPRPPRARAAVAKAAPLRPFEAVHWSVIALTLFTAFNVLVGAFGGDEAKPRELLPIMMVVTR